MKPLCVDLFCGLGGWAEGFLAAGYDVVGFDIEQRPYRGHLVLQDVLTLHGSQFKDAAIIVASPPCQSFSYRAMPWKDARAYRPDPLPDWWSKAEKDMSEIEWFAWRIWAKQNPRSEEHTLNSSH